MVTAPHMGIFILWLGLVVLAGHIIDMVAFVGLAHGIHHWSIVSLAGVTLLLHVPLFLAVVAGHIRILGSDLSELAQRSFGWVETCCF